MKLNPVRTYLELLGLGLIAFGAWCVFDTEGVAKIIGYEFASNDARVDFRAVYGGFDFAWGVFVLMASRRESLQYAAALLSTLMFTGLGITRFVSAASLGFEVASITWIALAFEVGGTLLSIWAMRRTAQQ